MRILALIVFSFCATKTPLIAVDNLHKLPYAGLVLDQIEVDGIEISDFSFHNGKKIAFKLGKTNSYTPFKHEGIFEVRAAMGQGLTCDQAI